MLTPVSLAIQASAPATASQSPFAFLVKFSASTMA